MPPLRSTTSFPCRQPRRERRVFRNLHCSVQAVIGYCTAQSPTAELGSAFQKRSSWCRGYQRDRGRLLECLVSEPLTLAPPSRGKFGGRAASAAWALSFVLS